VIQQQYDAEFSVIGSILIEQKQNLFPLAAEQLSPEDFQHPLCRKAFEVMIELDCDERAGKCVDPVAIANEMKDTEARKHLLTMAQSVPTTVNFMSYVGIVAENSRRRTAAAAARQLAEALEPDFGIGEALSMGECATLAERVTQAFEGKEQRAAVGMGELFAGFDERMAQKPNYFRTGIGKLDGAVHIAPGHFAIVAGRPSSGKTAFTLQAALHMAHLHNVVYYSLETSPANLFDRAVACYAGVDMENIKTRKLTPQEKAAVNRAREDMQALRLHIVSAAGWTVQQIRASAMALRADVVFIDYLGLIKGSGKGRYEVVTQVSIDLHTAAQRTGVAMVALSQLNRTGAGMAALRESGQVEQDADVIIMLEQPDENNPNARTIRVEKNKDGEVCQLDISFRGNFQRFGLVDNFHEPPPLPPASQADFEEIGGGGPW